MDLKNFMKNIGPITYKLELASGSKIYHVFHVSKLKKHVGYEVITYADLPKFLRNCEL